MEGYSKDGRKLRPRKTAAPGAARSEKVDYSSAPERGGREARGSYGDHSYHGSENRRNYGDKPAYGGNQEHRRSFGDKPSYGGGSEHRKSYGDKPAYGGSQEHRRNFGDKPAYGDNTEHRRSFGDKPSNGGGSEHRRSYGDKPAYGGNTEHRRSFGDKPSYGENTDRRRSFSDKPAYGGNQERRRNFTDKPESGFSRGGRKSFAKKGGAPTFTKESNEGINRMINRRPQLDRDFEDYEAVPETIQSEIRLNRFIANSGVCSRREADTLIQAGVVTVNGEVVTELGTKVNIFDDDIRFNGERLKGEQKVYIVMNKPKGFVTTASDPHADKTVLDLVKDCTTRVYPVGRLDKNTTGVLMLTNDGEIAERLTHPSYDKKKIYQVALDRELDREDFDKILAGMALSDGEVAADSLEYIDESDHRKLGIEIHSGKNRIVRRIFESLGYTVKALDRVYFAGLTKKGLKKGEWRYLSESEINILRMGAYI